jgi:hypothetical protein
MAGLNGRISDPNDNGVFGGNDSTASAPAGQPVGNGVFGFSNVPNASGVFGANNGGGIGVAGTSENGFGVRGDSTNAFAAVHGHGGKNGVWGFTVSANDSGVFGQNDGTGGGPGVSGFSANGEGVIGDTNSPNHNGIVGRCNATTPNTLPAGSPPGGNGIFGFSNVPNASGVIGANNNGGVGITGIGKLAGQFFGDVEVTGDIRLVNADCAEDFDIAGTEQIEPGTVMVIDPVGALQQSQQAYDKRVAGVISGAGDMRPGIVLDKRQSLGNRLPVALLGKVYCKIDAQYSPIEVGDLLTTSPTPGHAMKAADPFKAFGSVIGKALRPLESGQGLIPILIALQ